MASVEVKVPDIGDFKDVPVIELLVKPGDSVKPEDPLVTLESDKATMDVPSPAAGTVKAITVKVGDKVSEGTALMTLETETAAQTAPPGGKAGGEAAPAGGRAADKESAKAAAAPAGRAAPSPAAPSGAVASSAPAQTPAAGPAADSYGGRADVECEMLVLGSGPGGYSAAFRAADLGMKTVLVERYPTLGGVCLNVGCIPSKALLHTAAVMDEVKTMGAHGITYSAPKIDLDKLRSFKDSVVKKLTGGLAGMAKARKVEFVRGVGRFLDPHHLEVQTTTGSGHETTAEKKVVRFEKAIIAAGSEAMRLPFMPKDPRIVDST
jgi:dihydrolipoamide dehydrogenase